MRKNANICDIEHLSSECGRIIKDINALSDYQTNQLQIETEIPCSKRIFKHNIIDNAFSSLIINELENYYFYNVTNTYTNLSKQRFVSKKIDYAEDNPAKKVRFEKETALINCQINACKLAINLSIYKNQYPNKKKIVCDIIKQKCFSKEM